MLLSRHPEGLSADHLAMLLDDNDLDIVTVRAEMSRLRRVIGAEFVASRPYRLLTPIRTDMGDVFDALEAGDVDDRGQPIRRRAAAAIGVAGCRAAAHRAQRERPRSASSPRETCGFCAAGWTLPKGATTVDGWRTLHDQTAPGSVMRAQASGHLAGLDFDLA